MRPAAVANCKAVRTEWLPSVTNVVKVDFRAFCLALLALSVEVSPQAARDGGRFDGKLKMASGRDRLIAGSVLATPTPFWQLALSNRRFGERMTIMADNRMMAQMSSKDGFIAALDQSGGSTPAALRLWGIPDSAYGGER